MQEKKLLENEQSMLKLNIDLSDSTSEMESR